MNTYIVQKRSVPLYGLIKLVGLVALSISGNSYGVAFPVSEELLLEVQTQHGVAAEQRLRDWQQIIDLSEPRDDMEKLVQVNGFINRAHQTTQQRQRSDQRINPLQFLIYHAGDGQSFAMTKLFTLHKMGMSLAKLRIGYVRIRNRLQAETAQFTSPQLHTVLVYFSTPDAEPLILDNLDKRIRPASQRTDLVPVYLFEARDILLPDVHSSILPIENPHYVEKWQNLLPNLRSVHY
jgi:predicted transglutaminase-like cysteine proteinase